MYINIYDGTWQQEEQNIKKWNGGITSLFLILIITQIDEGECTQRDRFVKALLQFRHRIHRSFYTLLQASSWKLKQVR